MDDNKKQGYQHFIHDFSVDFLGGLVPGLLFTVAAFTAIYPAVWLMIKMLGEICDVPEQSIHSINFVSLLSNTLKTVQNTPSSIWLLTAIFYSILSYLIGHLFYRRDPKLPDRKSFRTIVKSDYGVKFKKGPAREKMHGFLGFYKYKECESCQNADINQCIVIPKAKTVVEVCPIKDQLKQIISELREFLSWLGISKFKKYELCEDITETKDIQKRDLLEQIKRDTGSQCPYDCQFPYTYFKEYLEARGHHHLIKHLYNRNTRSKTFMNRIKVRLEYYFPDKYRRLTRNEAHVRLSTSTWYAAHTLSRICAGSIMMCLVLGVIGDFFIRESTTQSTVRLLTLQILVFPTILLALAWFARHSIEKFIHYQRLREVFHVLELAYAASKDRPDLLEQVEPGE